MPDVSELLIRIRQTFISHFDEDGTVYLSQQPEANLQQQSISPDGFVTVQESPERARETLSHAASNVHNEGGKPSPRARGKQSKGPPNTVSSEGGIVLGDKVLPRINRRVPKHVPKAVPRYIETLDAVDNISEALRAPSPPDIKSSDVFILVMGQAGCGKSTFINSAAGESAVEINKGIDASSTIQLAICSHPTSSKLFALVETPGFDNTDKELSDSAILRGTAKWLEELFYDGVKFGGIIYVQQGEGKTPMLTLLKDGAVKQNLLHIVSVFSPDRREVQFQVPPSQEPRPVWTIIDQLSSSQDENLTLENLERELGEIAGVPGEGRPARVVRGLVTWLSSRFH